jgi:hypothetical protein
MEANRKLTKQPLHHSLSIGPTWNIFQKRLVFYFLGIPGYAVHARIIKEIVFNPPCFIKDIHPFCPWTYLNTYALSWKVPPQVSDRGLKWSKNYRLNTSYFLALAEIEKFLAGINSSLFLFIKSNFLRLDFGEQKEEDMKYN